MSINQLRLTYTVFCKIIMYCFHCIGPDTCDIQTLLIARIYPQRVGFLCDEIRNFVTDFLAENQFVWKMLCQGEHQTTISAANINNWGSQLVLIFLVILHWKFACVHNYFVLVVVWNSKKWWVVQMPLGVLSVLWHRNFNLIHWVNMRPHPMLILFWHVHSSYHLSVIVFYKFFL